MKLKLFFALALAAVVCLPANAQKKAKKTKAKTATTAVETPAAPSIKPVDGKTFSEALGIAQSESLKQYLTSRENIDAAHLAEAMKGMTAEISDEERAKALAYAAGLRIAQINKQNLPYFNKQAAGSMDTTYVDVNTFQNALSKAVLGETCTMTADSAMKVVENQIKYQQEIYKARNLDWLAQNAKLKGVQRLADGLQYRILTEGTGPVADDSTEVEVHYEGSLIDGTVFDSSYKRNKPSTFRPDQVIKGWREALKMMPEGSVWNLYIPYDLAYGERGQGEKIPGFSTLIFNVEVLKVKKEPAKTN